MLRMIASALAALFLALFAGAPANAQQYPTKAIRIIVPYPAGAAGDILARLFGEFASARLGQPIVVDNRPGGAGIAATDAVAKAEPDGYTLLLTGPNHATNVGLYKSLPYDPDKDFAPISLIGTDYTVIMANPKAGFATIQELIAKAKASPGTINFSSSGIGTAGHLSMERFQKAAGIKLVHIPYRGATPAMTDTVSGQVPLNITSPAPALAYIKSGRLIPLVISSPARIAPLPDVPTGKDIGIDWIGGAWFGLTAPAKTPRPIIDRLAKEVAAAVASDKIKERLAATATVPGGDSPEEFQALIRSEIKRWPQIIKDAGIEMQ
jgi:tripartite-type tricarboxylate transporter receptor subunit TctC